MKRWNEFGVEREADESTFTELLMLRSAVHKYENMRREKEQSELILTLNRIADILGNIEKKMGQ